VGKRKKSAAASLQKLSRGLMRETPTTRAAGKEAEQPGGPPASGAEARPEARPEDGGGGARPEKSGGGAAGGRPRRKTGRPRTRPQRMVRVSVDLPRPSHRYLRDFAYDAESDGMSVMRALLEEMREDEDLADRVLDRLARK
jgi:hypothetical protein